MSDKKTPAGTPLGAAPTNTSLEQEFEKFLHGEATSVDAIYRKLPQAEPDAQLDARVRALARGAQRETSPPALSTPAVLTSGDSPARARRRWIPAFASAAALVLAAGIVWRMGPQDNWAQKDTTSRVALDATATSNATATTTGAPAPSIAVAAPQAQAAADTGGYSSAAKSTGAAQANRADARDAPLPFPAAKPAPPDFGGAPASPAPAELRKAEAARTAEPTVATSHSAGPPSAAREKSASAGGDARRAELQPETPASARTVPGAADAEIADRSTIAAAKAHASASAPALAAAPPPMQAPAPAPGFAPEPSAASTAPTPKPTLSTAGHVDDEAKKQSYADHFTLPPGSPQANIPGRPTPAQLAAWPAPNCHAAGTGAADARAWNYPPNVPDSAQQRFVTVKNYLDLDSREGALKAYADFRHCYPDDSWPQSLLQRLGTQ